MESGGQRQRYSILSPRWIISPIRGNEIMPWSLGRSNLGSRSSKWAIADAARRTLQAEIDRGNWRVRQADDRTLTGAPAITSPAPQPVPASGRGREAGGLPRRAFVHMPATAARHRCALSRAARRSLPAARRDRPVVALVRKGTSEPSRSRHQSAGQTPDAYPDTVERSTAPPEQ